MTDPPDRQATVAHGMHPREVALEPHGESVVPRAHFPHHEMLRPRVLAVAAITSVIFVAFAVAVAPSDSHTLTWTQRTLYFGSIAAISFPICYSLVTMAHYFTRNQPFLVSAIAALAATAFASVPVTAMGCIYPVLFYPGRVAPRFGPMFVTVVAPAISACLLMTLVIYQRIRDYREAGELPVFPRFRGKTRGGIATGVVSAGPDGAGAVNPPPEPVPSPAAPMDGHATTPVRNFLSRLPVDVGDEIIYIKTEGHYLRVHTKAGTSRMLMRFADAVAELSGCGLQVHRSYWVAHDQIMGLVKRDNSPALLLTDDHLVPVSRTHMKAVRAVVPD
jgi:hypothetical protein